MAGDDADDANNTFVSDVINVPAVYTEGGEDNSDTGTVVGSLTNVSDTSPSLTGGVLDDGELLRIDGLNDNKNNFDTYRIVLGTSVTRIALHAEWTLVTNSIDLYLWDEFGNEWALVDWLGLTEPQDPDYPEIITGLTAGATCYIGVKFNENATTGNDYRVFIQGNP